MFLKLRSAELQGTAKGCQGFRVTKTGNDGRVLLAVQNFYVGIKISVPTFDTNHSVTVSTQSIAVSIQKLPDSVVRSLAEVHVT